MNESIFYFIGVSTQGSSTARLFPLWMQELGIPNAHLRGVDIPLHAAPERYRQTVNEITSLPQNIGGLVTTHKIDLFNAASDLFDELDANAQLCGEISCITRRNGKLQGLALDPISSGQTLDEMLGAGYWGATKGEVLCLGAGGAAAAIALNFVNRSDPSERPWRFTVVDINPQRLVHLRHILEQQKGGIDFVFLLAGDNAPSNDELMAQLPAHSLVINATGMGKDRPGSPISDRAIFPQNGVVWELNYRGERLFLQQALPQVERQNLQIYDGWRYFLHGWISHIAKVFDVEVGAERFARLVEISNKMR